MKNTKNSEKKVKYPYFWAVLYGLLLTGYGVFSLLDAFVIPRDLVYVTDPQESGETNSLLSDQQEDRETEPIITENSYECSQFSVHITTFNRYDTQIYVADVVLSDISYLKAGLAGGVFGRNVRDTTSSIAEENGAVFAINGDYYGFRDSGFVMRNGYLYRDIPRSGSGNEALAVYGDGSFEIFDEAESDALELAQEGALHIFSFGPGLVEDGAVTVDEDSEVEQAMRSNPRTAIGVIEPLHYVLLVSDGRTSESEGLSLYQLAQVMESLGCTQAYNLDGGGSSTMWFMGEVINKPTTSGNTIKERSVSDIVYIGLS